jgi:hypothetical protein
MMTIICEFRQFSAKKLAFFLKANGYNQIFVKTSVFWTKTDQISAIFNI